ncbi:MAG: metallophosphoesterase family protein [Polyangiaceae bacterium]
MPRAPKANPTAVAPTVERITLGPEDALRLVVVSDTHSAPHPATMSLVAAEKPDYILHAGDIGDTRVIEDLATLCPCFAVRGNIDVRSTNIPEARLFEVAGGERDLLRILMLHIGVYGPKLRSEVIRLAREHGATLVVCGHSHVPFVGRDRGIFVFNPGSVGPKRFGLPIVFGVMDIAISGSRLRHVDCETGRPFAPPSH